MRRKSMHSFVQYDLATYIEHVDWSIHSQIIIRQQFSSWPRHKWMSSTNFVNCTNYISTDLLAPGKSVFWPKYSFFFCKKDLVRNEQKREQVFLCYEEIFELLFDIYTHNRTMANIQGSKLLIANASFTSYQKYRHWLRHYFI